jgi:hypothetical protein
MDARMCACMHNHLHTKVPDLTSDDTGSPPYGVCHHLLVDSARYSSRVPVVPALARALPRASCGLSFCLAPYRAPSLRPEPRGRVTGPTCGPHKYNGKYGPGLIRLITPGDTFFSSFRSTKSPRRAEQSMSTSSICSMFGRVACRARVAHAKVRPCPGLNSASPFAVPASTPWPQSRA